MAPRRRNPALQSRSSAPIHSSRSGLTGFFTSTGRSHPRSASAICCTAKGFDAVRAPIHSRSTPASSAAATCSAVAASVATYMPVSRRTRRSHAKPSVPTPSKPPGLVRGFHSPARKIRTPSAARRRAVASVCSSVSALQGPATTSGRRGSTPAKRRGCSPSIASQKSLSIDRTSIIRRRTDSGTRRRSARTKLGIYSRIRGPALIFLPAAPDAARANAA